MKLAIVVRKDLGMRPGKIAVQCGHASVIAYRIACGTDEADRWFEEGQKKIVLKCADEVDMKKIGLMAQMSGLQVNPVVDFGLTQIEPHTTTCIAIGPSEDERIDAITKNLSLL